MPDMQGINKTGPKLCYLQASLKLWSQMGKCAFPDTKPPIEAFGQVIVRVVTEEEQ